MRELTQEELQVREERVGLLRVMMEEKPHVLYDFAVRMGLAEVARELAAEPGRYVGEMDAALREHAIGPGRRVWMMTSLNYFIGDVMAARLGGSWFLNDRPGSAHFMRWVVGREGKEGKPGVMVDPLEVADGFLSLPVGRSLAGVLEELGRE